MRCTESTVHGPSWVSRRCNNRTARGCQPNEKSHFRRRPTAGRSRIGPRVLAIHPAGKKVVVVADPGQLGVGGIGNGDRILTRGSFHLHAFLDAGWCR